MKRYRKMLPCHGYPGSRNLTVRPRREAPPPGRVPFAGAPSFAHFAKGGNHGRVKHLESFSPIPRLSFAVRDGDDRHKLGVVEVDDGKWEAMNDEPASSVQVFWPAMRAPRNCGQRVVHIRKKCKAHVWAAREIPIVGRFKFLPRLRMQSVRLRPWHRAVESSVGAVPAPPELSSLFRSEYHPRGV